MNAGRDVERLIADWLVEESPGRAPDRILVAAAQSIDRTKQRPLAAERNPRIPWRLPTMNLFIRLAGAAIAVAIVAGAAVLFLRPVAQVGPSTPTIEGTWEAQFTRQQMLTTGIVDAGEDDPSNYGHFILSFRAGRFSMVQLDTPTSVAGGTYVVNGATITLRSNIGETFANIPFTVSATSLTFGAGGPVTYRAVPWTRIESAVPVGSATGVTVASYKAARDAICVAARPARQAFDARIGTGLYDPATTASDRASKLAALQELEAWAEKLVDQVDALPVPDSMAYDVGIAVAQSRGNLALIREEFPLIQAGKLSEAQSIDLSTDPIAAHIGQFESFYGLQDCPA